MDRVQDSVAANNASTVGKSSNISFSNFGFILYEPITGVETSGQGYSFILYEPITGVETSGQGYSMQEVLANFITIQCTKLILFKSFLHTLHQNSN